MNTYNVVIDDSMIRNMMQTDIHESIDLISIKQIAYLIFLGLLPSYVIYKLPIHYRSIKKEFLAKILTILIALAIIALAMFTFSKHYTSFFREHKPLRYSVNPIYWIYSTGKYIDKTFNTGEIVVKPIGLDAHIEDNNTRKKLVIMVVGEAARADHFSLNGYPRKTNPQLQQENIINFAHLSSCGTSTAVSVPCMFSVYERDSYSYKKGIRTQNVLDVINHTKKVAILWRDNNSDSKGVALRVPYEDYKTSNNNTICVEGECRDIGMLVGLDDFIQKNKDKHILIVLHQMGNHGPAYYKRYTKEFEKFTPTCKTNQLEACTQEEIANAYDNAILYTDHFLAQTIQYLKKYDTTYNTLMFYIADHGESLGENGLYLHGMPYFIAPDAQTHVGALMWVGDKTLQKMHLSHIKQNKDKTYSQDNLFHTLLGIFDIKTKVYQVKMDMIHDQ
jgi:lipid A ethanolaminephosphotransferase